MKWNKKQKEAFIRIQNEVLSKIDITNKEVAEMFTLNDKETVFSLFQFSTAKWINELKLKPYYESIFKEA